MLRLLNYGFKCNRSLFSYPRILPSVATNLFSFATIDPLSSQTLKPRLFFTRLFPGPKAFKESATRSAYGETWIDDYKYTNCLRIEFFASTVLRRWMEDGGERLRAYLQDETEYTRQYLKDRLGHLKSFRQRIKEASQPRVG